MKPWFKAYQIMGLRESLEPYPEVPLYYFLEESAKNFPDSTAVTYLEKQMIYSELLDAVNRLANGFSEHISKGDRVLITLRNCPQLLIAELAALKCGASAVLVSPLQPEKELKDIAERTNPKIVVGEKKFSESGIFVETKPSSFMGDDDFWNLIKSSQPDPPDVEINPKEDVAAILFTGGVTGVPKGVMLTHYNLTTNVLQVLPWLLGGAAEAVRGSGSVLLASPIFHSYGHWGMHVGIYWAFNLLIVSDPRNYDEILGYMKKYSPWVTVGVPGQYMKLIKREIEGLWTISVSGSAPLPKSTAKEYEKKAGIPIVEGYGLTETSPVTHINIASIARFLGLDAPDKTGSIGVPVPDTDVRIVKEDGSEADAGEEGEMQIKGPQVMKGYWNTEDPFVDGWLPTGDIACMDEDGFFYIVDRVKDMINVSGYKVYSRVVEEVLHQHPAVELVAVVGIPDKEREGSERVKAFVKLFDGASATPDEIREFCREKLPPYAVPVEVEIREKLPQAETQKILKRLLLQ